MNNSNHLIIMAGGVGNRFWPVSTREKPKQFIDVLGCGKSLLQLTVEHFKGICPTENIWIVTSEEYAQLVHEQLSQIADSNILKEPCRRNTAACIAYAAWRIKKIDPHANMVVSPSDHLITDVAEFQRVINSSLRFVADSDAILTIGIKPTRPETGFGYIEAALGNASLSNKEIYRVDSFKEKPDIDTATAYISKKNFYWNSGVFIWNVQTVVNAFRIYQPQIAQIFESMLPVYGTAEESAVLAEKFPYCRNISVDYAILEHADEVFVFPADFGWSDLGTWTSLHSHLGQDLNGNVLIGEDISIYDSHNCIVHTENCKKVILIGLNDCVVSEQDGNLLVCKLNEEERIKELTKESKK